MNKKTWIFSFVLFIALIVGVFFYFYRIPVYAYVDELNVKDDMISFRVFGSGNFKYGGYEITEKEDGEYIFQLYGKMLFGEYYPKEIQIDNKDKKIEKLIQKSLNEKEIELIYKY